jgi:hypothetical protein
MLKRAGILIAVFIALLTFACASGPSDEQIATEIKAKFYATEGLRNTNLQVTAKNGEVTLSGDVPSDAVRIEAFKLALDAQGVRKVHDQMIVRVAEIEPPPVEEPKPAPRPVVKAVYTKPATRRAAAAPAPAPIVQDPAPAPIVQDPAPAQAPAPAPAPQVAAPPPPPQPKKITIDAGTSLAVRMIDSIDSGVNQPGETFRASLDAPIDVDGEEVIPRGADVTVRLSEAKAAGRMAGRGELKLDVAYLEFQGKRYTVQTSDVSKVGRSEGKRTAATVGGTAAVGAIIGAIAGGGKGAAIGAAAGAGAGAGASVLTKGQQVKVPSETLLEFRLESPLTVTVYPDRGKSRRANEVNE